MHMAAARRTDSSPSVRNNKILHKYKYMHIYVYIYRCDRVTLKNAIYIYRYRYIGLYLSFSLSLCIYIYIYTTYIFIYIFVYLTNREEPVRRSAAKCVHRSQGVDNVSALPLIRRAHHAPPLPVQNGAFA